jgi:hypothetical protein
MVDPDKKQEFLRGFAEGAVLDVTGVELFVDQYLAKASESQVENLFNQGYPAGRSNGAHWLRTEGRALFS